MNDLPRILFLCTGNSCRSQIAEGWARHLAGERMTACSAGTAPVGINPRALEVMAEVGVDLAGQRSRHLDEVRAEGEPDWVITLCGDAHETCPVFPGPTRVVHHGFTDPAKATGSPEEQMAVFRRVRDEIRALVETLPGSLAGR